MPALPNVPSVIRMRLKFTLGSDTDVLPHSYWEYTGGAPTNAQLVTMATGIESSLVTAMTGMFNANTTWTAVELTDLSSPTAAVGEFTFSHVGTRSGSNLPASAAANIAFQIARRYRGGKPRTEMPWFTQGDLNTSQTWNTTSIANANTTWGDVQTAMTSNIWSGGGSISQVNVSYYGPPNRTVTSSTGRVRTISTTRAIPLIDPVLSYGCQSRVGSVRRRLGKAA